MRYCPTFPSYPRARRGRKCNIGIRKGGRNARGIRLRTRENCGACQFYEYVCTSNKSILYIRPMFLIPMGGYPPPHPLVPFSVSQSIPSNSPQSALTCVEFTTRIQQSFHEVTVPFLCMIANEDVVVDNAMARELMEKSPSNDKTIKSYAALHGLLCEPAPLLGIIEDDFVQWILKRCPR
jgi:hypothetical protein